MLQRAQNLGGKMHRFLPGQCAAALLQVFFQGDAVHILHHDILQPVGHRHVIHLDDVGVIQDGDRLGLVFEAADQFLIVEKFFLEHFDGDGVAVLFVHTAVHVGHAADADEALNQITAIEPPSNQIIHC